MVSEEVAYRIETLSAVYWDAAYRDSVLPPALQGRPLEDVLVIDALERWAAAEAASILAILFLIAGLVTAVAVVPALLMGRGRPAGAVETGQTEAVQPAPASDTAP